MDSRGRLRTSVGVIRWPDQIVLLPLCVAEASLLWIGAAAVLGVPSGEHGVVSPWLAFALVWGTTALLRSLEALDVWEPWHQIATALGVAFSLGISIRIVSFPHAPLRQTGWFGETLDGLILRSNTAAVPVWSVVGLVAVVWWRAFFRGEPTRDAAFRLMRVGTLIALSGACALALIDRVDSDVDSSAAVLIFFVAALAAIGLSRLTSGDHAGQAELSVRSVLTGLAPAAAVLALGVIVTGALRQDLVDTVVWSLSPLIWALSVTVRVVVLAVALVAVLIMTPFLLLLDGRSFRMGSIRFDGSNLRSNGIMDRAADTAREIPDPIRYLIAAAVLLSLFAGATRFVLRRRLRRSKSARAEERERVRPLLDLPALLAALLRRLGLTGREQVDDPLDRLRGDARWSATVAIRERYRDFLRWSADRDLARPRGQTPAEHADLIAQALAGDGARGDVATIARNYGLARYSSEPASAADADAVQAAWRRLEHAGRVDRS